MSQNAHARKHWEGNYWGGRGAVKEGMFKFLSTLYSAFKSAPTIRHKFFVVSGIVTIFVILRLCYKLEDHTPDELDVLASVARRLHCYRFAVSCAECALKDPNITFTTMALLQVGMMRDCVSLRKTKFAQNLYELNINVLDMGRYSPPEQKIRILRALAWYEAAHGMEKEARDHAVIGLVLAKKYNAEDQAQAIREEFDGLIKGNG